MVLKFYPDERDVSKELQEYLTVLSGMTEKLTVEVASDTADAAGPGQVMDAETRERILHIEKQVDIKILVSLSCTMCPDLVTDQK